MKFNLFPKSASLNGGVDLATDPFNRLTEAQSLNSVATSELKLRARQTTTAQKVQRLLSFSNLNDRNQEVEQLKKDLKHVNTEYEIVEFFSQFCQQGLT